MGWVSKLGRIGALICILSAAMVATAEDAPTPVSDTTAAAVAQVEAASPSQDAEAHTLPTLSPGAEIVVVPIHGNIDLGLAPFVERALDEHPDAGLVIFDVDTFGGRVDAAVRIRDRLLEADQPTLAFVNARAISAGALISLAAESLVFREGASMGAATPVIIEGGEMQPVEEKMVSYMRAEMRTTAQAQGRDGQLAEAMVDRKIVIEGVVDDETLLTVSTREAIDLKLADRSVTSLDELLEAVGGSPEQVVTVTPNWAETVSRWLTDPTFAGILMSLGMLGLMVEVYSPGIGFPGALGVLCLSAFFGGHMVANLAGVEELVLLMIGLVLLIIEALVIPGFGIFGVLGLVTITMAFTMALVGMPLGASWDLGLLQDAFVQVSWSLLGTFVALIAIISLLPTRSVLPSFLVLNAAVGEGKSGPTDGPTDGASFRSSPDMRHLVGCTGTAQTDLRPAGKVVIDSQLIDVVSQQAWITKGSTVEVIEVEGVRVVVRESGVRS